MTEKKSKSIQQKKKLPAKERVGIFGGTFDPVHVGHLLGAQAALEQFSLDKVIFIPCRISPHKSRRPHVSDAQRLAMLRAALRGVSRFMVSSIELDRRGVSYSIDTVHVLLEKFPKSELFWVIGEDQVEGLSSWKNFTELKKFVRFIVLARSGSKKCSKEQCVEFLPSHRLFDISSTEIRKRVKEVKNTDWLLPAAVMRYIEKNNLYKKEKK